MFGPVALFEVALACWGNPAKPVAMVAAVPVRKLLRLKERDLGMR
jgi:hypothetical protein